MIKVGFRTMAAVPHQSVRQDDELSHDGDEGDFCGLSVRDQLIELRLEVAVKAHCGEGWHVDRAAQECSTTLDALMASATVARRARPRGQ